MGCWVLSEMGQSHVNIDGSGQERGMDQNVPVMDYNRGDAAGSARIWSRLSRLNKPPKA
jgi:hypothetical protein